MLTLYLFLVLTLYNKLLGFTVMCSTHPCGRKLFLRQHFRMHFFLFFLLFLLPLHTSLHSSLRCWHGKTITKNVYFISLSKKFIASSTVFLISLLLSWFWLSAQSINGAIVHMAFNTCHSTCIEILYSPLNRGQKIWFIISELHSTIKTWMEYLQIQH